MRWITWRYLHAMNRRSTLFLLAIALGAAAEVPAQAPAARPNIVVFVGDDLGWRDTGPYGNTAIRTPGIDRLARTGLAVRYAFGTSPQCSPSRIGMLSGRYPHATRTEDLHTPLPEGERILPSLLQPAGYFTGHMAKTHYGPNAERQFEWYAPETAAALPALSRCRGQPAILPVGRLPRAASALPGRTARPPARPRGAHAYLADTRETRRTWHATTTRSPAWTRRSARWSPSSSDAGSGSAR